jgi:hypothetical protein
MEETSSISMMLHQISLNSEGKTLATFLGVRKPLS